MARYNPLKIEQSVPELYPRLVQYVNGVFYDGNGNPINITGVAINNPSLNKLIISDGTISGLSTIPDVSFENGTLIVNANFQLTDGSQQNGYYLVSDANGLASWTSSFGATGPAGATGPSLYQTSFINVSTYSTTFTYQYYGVIYTSGICTITLPLGSSPADDGRFINIADEVGGISWGNRGILVQGQSGQLINGISSVLMKIERMSLDFMFRNNSWKTI